MAELQDKFTQTWMQESTMRCSLLAMGSSLHGPHPTRSLPAGGPPGSLGSTHMPLSPPLALTRIHLAIPLVPGRTGCQGHVRRHGRCGSSAQKEGGHVL